MAPDAPRPRSVANFTSTTEALGWDEGEERSLVLALRQASDSGLDTTARQLAVLTGEYFRRHSRHEEWFGSLSSALTKALPVATGAFLPRFRAA